MRARMAKSADAADLKSAGRKRLWEFKSPSGHHIYPLNMTGRAGRPELSITKSAAYKLLDTYGDTLATVAIGPEFDAEKAYLQKPLAFGSVALGATSSGFATE